MPSPVFVEAAYCHAFANHANRYRIERALLSREGLVITERSDYNRAVPKDRVTER